MGRSRRNFEPELKAKVALEAIKEERTLAQISNEWGSRKRHQTMEGEAFGESPQDF